MALWTHRLQKHLPDTLWRFLLNWYNNLTAVIKWNGHINYDTVFRVTEGTRQGSILSQVLSNMFISDLLTQLKSCSTRIGKHSYNSFAYADDITVYATTIPDLQELINICFQYTCSITWRFKFGTHKSQCLILEQFRNMLHDEPKFYLGEHTIY